jgi:hypothetical protein
MFRRRGNPVRVSSTSLRGIIARLKAQGLARRLAGSMGLVMLIAIILPSGTARALGTVNTVQLDDGTCGTDLRIGTDVTASSSATPSFMIWADGSSATYSMKIDGVAIGTFGPPTNAWNTCVKAPNTLAQGTHTISGNELFPNASNTVTPFTFTVDSIPPSAPTNLALYVGTDTGVVGDNMTTVTTPAIQGHGDPNFATWFYEGTSRLGEANDDANGNFLGRLSPALALGAHTIVARTVDEAGNFSANSAPYTLTITATDPTTTTTAPTTTTTTPPTTTTTTTTLPPTTTTTTTTVPPTTTTTTTPTTTTTTTVPPTSTTTGQSCQTLTATADLSRQVPALSGTLSSCNSGSDGAIEMTLDITGAPTTGSIVWTTAGTASLVTFTPAFDYSGGPCPAGDLAADVTLAVDGGPFYATSGASVFCIDTASFPILTVTALGPIKL